MPWLIVITLPQVRPRGEGQGDLAAARQVRPGRDGHGGGQVHPEVREG